MSLLRNDHVLQHFFRHAVTPLHVFVTVALVLELGAADPASLEPDAVDLAVVTLGLVQVAVSLGADEALGLAVVKLNNAKLEGSFFIKIA